MSIGILGQKVGMTRVYDDAGIITPVTVILAEPNAVLQVKTVENDGYAAVQVGVFDQKEHRVTKPELGHFKKAGVTPKRQVTEFTLNGETPKTGDTFTVTTFKPGQIVDVIGISKGKGFQGPMKKHNFHGQARRTVPRPIAATAPSVAARPRAAFIRTTAWPATWATSK